MINLETFCHQYLEPSYVGASKDILAQYDDQLRSLEDWRALWLRALAQPVQ
jgi:hypothetical protein